MNSLTGYHKNQAELLRGHTDNLVSLKGVEFVVMQTITFRGRVKDQKEASRILNSYLTNVIRPRYGSYIRVFERFKSRCIHAHVLHAVPEDVRTGVNFEEMCPPKGQPVPPRHIRYRTAGPYLRAYWKEMGNGVDAGIARDYKLGRVETLPIIRPDGIAFYIGKYISKHVGERLPEDKGLRLVSCSRDIKAGVSQFSRLTVGNRLWRAKLAELGAVMGWLEGDKRWKGIFHRNFDVISSIYTPAHLSQELADADECPVYPGDDKKREALWRELGACRISAEHAVRVIGAREEARRQAWKSRGVSAAEMRADEEWERGYQEAKDQRAREEAREPQKVKDREAWDIACPILI